MQDRRTYIGSADIGAIAGLDPYRGPMDVWAEKKGLKKEPDSHHIKRGVFLEDGLRQWYADQTSRLVMKGVNKRHESIEYIAATPDGIVTDAADKTAKAVLEIKAPSWRQAKKWEECEYKAPDQYVAQVSWQMLVYDVDFADIAALIDGNLRIICIDRDKEREKALMAIAEVFWRKHVLEDNPPAVDESNAWRDYICREFPRANLNMLESDPETDKIVQAYRHAREVRMEAEKSEQRLRNELSFRIGWHEGLIGEWGKIYHRNSKDRQITDWKGVAAEIDADIVKRHTETVSGARSFRPFFR